MKLSDVQKSVLDTLTKPYKNDIGGRRHHPQDAFKTNTLNALHKRGLVEFYNVSFFLGGAVRITDKGRKILAYNNSVLNPKPRPVLNRNNNVVVYNDGDCVFKGKLGTFLEDNEDDPYLIDMFIGKSSGDVVKFGEHSGYWVIKFV